jgi:dCTP deaminase
VVLSAKLLCERIRLGNSRDLDGITVVPTPDLDKLERSGETSVNLRLGRWFLALKQFGVSHLDLKAGGEHSEGKYAESFFVPFGGHYVLHPNRLVLASTLEWVRLPSRNAAFVVGKSTLGRRGVVIETAAGVHPGFSGCITLEIANVGEVPVKLVSGMLICQLFFHSVEGELASTSTSLSGQRKPRLGGLRADPILESLVKGRAMTTGS